MGVRGVRARLAFLVIAILLLGGSVPAFASTSTAISSSDNETPANWFVELTTPSISEGGSAGAAAASKDAFRRAAKARRVTYTERFAYGDLWNGLSLRATSGNVAKLYGIAGVRTIWPVVSLALAEPVAGGEQLDLATAIQMTGADYVQDTLGYTGKGIRVAVLDTGIDYDNPDLGGCFGRSCRVFTGWDFVGDDYNADPTSPAYQPVPKPDPDPDDCNGHGTHVSGIIGAKGEVTGVAPDVRFGAYRVFGCQGSTEADIMLAAMERALRDKMDVLNMSIGSAFQWPQYPTAVAADRLVTKHGMVVVASIGNNGANGLYSAGAPGVGENVIGVASFDNVKVTQPAFEVNGDLYGYQAASAAPPPPTSGSLPMSKTGATTAASDACAALPAGSQTGNAVLIRRGGCSFYQKAFNAQTAGAAAVVLYNNAVGFITPTVAGVPAITIPVVMLTMDQGATLDALVAAGPATMTWTAATTQVANPTGGLISSFSSYGLSPDLALKPDIGAPGGSIWSTLPLEQGGHGSLSGTSMSSPHVAGAVALLLQARPKNVKNDPALVRSLLMNTATPAPWSGNPGLGYLDSVNRQGAGMLNIRAAIEASAYALPGKLSLGESEAGAATRTVSITSRPGTGRAITYTLSSQPALATGPNTFAPSFSTAAATVTFSTASVTVKNNQTASFAVTITPPAAPAGGTYGGYVVASGDDGSTLRIPYAGFIGDYQSIAVLTGLAAVCRADAAGNLFLASGGTFTLTDATQTPLFCVHFNHQSRSVTFTATDTITGDSYTAIVFDYFGRNSTSTGIFAIDWDGASGVGAARTNVPDGTYEISVDVLKALGDPTDPAHTESRVLGTLTIDRP